VDRKQWAIPPQEVGANELILQNALTFTAAAFQPPYFDPQATDASNYAAIGSTIGHEISHTFDIEGSAVDSKGRVRNWWKPADLAQFSAVTAKLVAQYDAYKPLPDLAINGKQVLNESIADLGGLVATYDAYHAPLAGKTAPEVNGFSGDQQFFLAFAQFDCSKSTDAYLRQTVMTNEHPPTSSSSLRCATLMRGTQRSMSSPETNSTSLRPTACAFGKASARLPRTSLSGTTPTSPS
jgi:putative endopeptidase